MALHSLKARFAFLLAAFGLVVVINVATMLWGLVFLERQLDEPMRAMETSLSLLNQAKRAAGKQHNLIATGSRVAAIGPVARESTEDEQSPRREEILDQSAVSREAVARLIESDHLEFVLGVGVPRYLASRVDQAESAVRMWLDEGDVATQHEALDMLHDIHERIEATEVRILNNAQFASTHTETLRFLVVISLIASVVIAALAGVLAVQLVRRWVLSQVTALREATERFGQGELEYRVRVSGQGELVELASEFNAMASTIVAMQAERIEQERLAAFGTATGRIVHNIKSPLSGIRMMAELAESEHDPSDRSEQLSRIVSTVDRLNMWLKRLLDLTRPEQLQRATIRPDAWMKDVLTPLDDQAKASGIELNINAAGAPEAVSADPTQLEQALVALVSNALDVTPANGTVTVSAWSENSGNAARRWGIDVTDDGPGVPLDVASQLFRPYFTTKSQGNGIGLAMAQKIARDHGGDAWLRDAGGGSGAVFALWLPVE